MNEITISECTKDDAADLWRFRSRAEGKLGIFEHFARTFASFEDIYNFLVENALSVNKIYSVAALRCGSEIVGVGIVVKTRVEEPREAEIAGYVLPEIRGTVNASQTFLRWAFAAFPGYKFIAETRAFNTPALQALKSAGFKVDKTESGDISFSR